MVIRYSWCTSYGDNLKMWAGLADSLATTHRVIAVDARGFGRSGKPAGAESYGPAMVQDLVALLDTAGARQAQAKSFSDQLFAESDSAALVGVMKSFGDLSVDWARVDSSRIPAVAIVGVDDPLRPYSRDIAVRWPGAKLVELPATDHMTIPASPRLLEEIRLVMNTSPRQ